jgi:multidrug resistance protein
MPVSVAYPESGRSKVLAVLCLCSFFVGWDSLVTVPLLPAITEDTGVPRDLGALLVTAYALAYLLSAPIFGAISDRVGRKRMILLGMLVLGIGTALIGLGNGLTTLLLFRALTGVGAGMVEPSVYALIGNRFPYGERGRSIGLVTGMLIASTLSGVPLGGYLAEVISWRYTFWIIGLLAVAALVAVHLGIPNDRPEAEVGGGRGHSSALRSTLGQFRAAFSTASVFFALLATFLWFGGLQGTFASVGLFYSRYFGFDEAQNGLVLMVAGLGSVVGSVIGGRLSDRLGKRAVVGASSVVAAASVFALVSVATGSLPFAVSSHVLWAVAFASGQAALPAWSPSSTRG